MQNCTQRARRDVLALVDRHDRGARGIVEVSDHHVATSSMNFDKTNASQRSKGPGATYLGQSAHAALDAIRSVSKLARGFGIGRFSFFSPSK